MVRKIIEIDQEKCDGCGLCVRACHEGAIGLENGKAALLRDDYCDGLGNCLPVCPAGAIRFVERDAAEYDADAAARHIEAAGVEPLPCGCPGTQARALARGPFPDEPPGAGAEMSALGQWPVQIRLVPVKAPYFANAALLVAADCTAYAYAAFHRDFMRNKITLIGCPKLDETDYAEKLGAILKANAIKSLTVVRMEVPCCGGIVSAVKTALQASGKMIPWQSVVISTGGRVISAG